MATTPIQDACRKVGSIQSDYVAEYEFDDAEHQTHYPTDFETLLIDDAINGLLANEDFIAAFIEWMLLVHGGKHNEPECPICAAISASVNQRNELLGLLKEIRPMFNNGDAAIHKNMQGGIFTWFDRVDTAIAKAEAP